MKLIKNGIIKDVEGEKDVADYIDAGWEKYEKKESVKFIKDSKIRND